MMGDKHHLPWRFAGQHPVSCSNTIEAALPNMRRTWMGSRQSSCVPVSCPNVEVKDDHTYFVEDGSGLQTPVWVHNSCNKDETVDQVLRRKRGNIKNAPLKRGSPSWEEIRYMKM